MDFVLSNPKPSVPGYKIRITFGFFDHQTGFFQTTIPASCFEVMYPKISSIRGVVTQAVVIQKYQGFQQFAKVNPSMWDLRIDYVSCERQAIFVNSRTRTIEAVCAPEFFEVMQTSILEILSKVSETDNSSYSPDAAFSFEIY